MRKNPSSQFAATILVEPNNDRHRWGTWLHCGVRSRTPFGLASFEGRDRTSRGVEPALLARGSAGRQWTMRVGAFLIGVMRCQANEQRRRSGDHLHSETLRALQSPVASNVRATDKETVAQMHLSLQQSPARCPGLWVDMPRWRCCLLRRLTRDPDTFVPAKPSPQKCSSVADWLWRDQELFTPPGFFDRQDRVVCLPSLTDLPMPRPSPPPSAPKKC